VTVSECYRPQISATQFPTRDTRPQNSTDMLLEGLDEDPDFWNMAPDDEDSPAAHQRKPEPTVEQPMKQQNNVSRKHPGKSIAKGTGSAMSSLLGFKTRPDGKYE